MTTKSLYEAKDLSGGLNVGTRPHLIKENQVQDCQNVDFLPGKVSTCKGYSLFNNRASDRAYTFIKQDGSTQLVEQVGDKLYIDGVEKKSGISGFLSFETFKGLLFCINENHAFIWDGTYEQVWGVEAPTSACTATVSATAGTPAEQRAYYVTFVNNKGQESNSSPISTSVTPASKQVNLTNILTGGTNIVKRKIYAYATLSKGGSSVTDSWYVGEISDNTTTTFTDNISAEVLVVSDVLEIDNDPPGKAKYILQHKNRIFTAVNSMLYFSKLDSPEAFPIDNYILCNDSGDKITGLWLLNDYIVIIKERSVLMLKCDGEPTEWILRTVHNQRGCPYPNTIQLLDDKIVFLGHDDLYVVFPYTEYSTILKEKNIDPIGERVKTLLSVSPGDIPVSADYDGRYWLKIGSYIIIYDYRRDNFTKYVFPNAPKWFHVTPDYKLYFSVDAGTMLYGNSTTFNGQIIQSYCIGRDVDMGRRSQKKKIKRIYTYYKKQAKGDKMYVQFGTDETGYTNPIIIEYTDGYMEWGSGEWGELWGGSDSPGKQSNTLSDQNNYFRIKFGSTTDPFEFYGYGIVYKLKKVR